MKKEAVKPYIRCVGFLVGLAILLCASDYLFAPSGYIRYILHQISGTEENYDTIILGASHARTAINPYKIDEALGCNTINAAIPGETIKDSYYILKDACANNDIQRVILDVDYQYWMKDQVRGDFSEPYIYSQMKPSAAKLEYLVDNMGVLDIRNVFTKRNSYQVGFHSATHNVSVKWSQAYRDYQIEAAEVQDADGPYVGKGFFFRNVSGFNPGGDAYVDTWVGRAHAGIDEHVMDEFSQIKNFCDANGIELICVTTPITPSVMEKLEMGVVHDTLVNDLFEPLHVTYYDFNMTKMSVLPRQDRDYGDKEGHMGGGLANEYSEMLARALKEAQAGQLHLENYLYPSFETMYQNMAKDYYEVTSQIMNAAD